MTIRSLLLATAFACLLAPSMACAQGQVRTRQGFWFNGGLGWGTADCEGCTGERPRGTAGVLAVGGTVSQRLLLGASLNAWMKQDDNVTLTLGALTAAMRFYPARTIDFFLLAGLGISSREVKNDFGNTTTTFSDNGTAALIGVGYDIRIRNNLSLTPFANAIGVDFDGQGTGFTQVGLSVTLH